MKIISWINISVIIITIIFIDENDEQIMNL
jgi:hypothetical protein